MKSCSFERPNARHQRPKQTAAMLKLYMIENPFTLPLHAFTGRNRAPIALWRRTRINWNILFNPIEAERIIWAGPFNFLDLSRNNRDHFHPR